jgi:hypothetical protein
MPCCSPAEPGKKVRRSLSGALPALNNGFGQLAFRLRPAAGTRAHIGTLSTITSFFRSPIKFPARIMTGYPIRADGELAAPAAGSLLAYRHSVIVRLTHWIGVVCVMILLMSGLQIQTSPGGTSAHDCVDERALPAPRTRSD